MHREKVREQIAKRIAHHCPGGNIRQGRRILRGAMRLFEKRGGKFHEFTMQVNMDACVFRGKVGDKFAATAFTGLDAMQTNLSPRPILQRMAQRFEVAA